APPADAASGERGLRIVAAVAVYLAVQATVALAGRPGAHLSTAVVAPGAEGVRDAEGKAFACAFDRTGRRVVHEADGKCCRSAIGAVPAGGAAAGLGCAMAALAFADAWR